MMAAPGLSILSLDNLEIQLTEEVYQHLASSYKTLFASSKDPDHEACRHLDRVLQSMKMAPRTSIFRINQVQSSKAEVIKGLGDAINEWIRESGATDLISFSIQEHPILPDVVTVDVHSSNNGSSLRSRNVPPPHKYDSLFRGWPKRKAQGWPLTHKVVICDRFCGEAVLRGSHVFVRGILCADDKIQKGDIVAVYADLGERDTPIPRGLYVEYYSAKCVFLGLGEAACSRADFFRNTSGLGVTMSPLPWERAGPVLPPLSGVLPKKVYVQNLPSIVVAHALQPVENCIIFDMCAAPGGKTLHLASLVNNKATIVASDRSRKKMIAAGKLFQSAGCACITPLALDTTNCVERDPNERWKSVNEVLSEVSEKGGLLNVSRFYPESFDRILLDPPCSALGLRPKLQIVQTSLDDLMAFARYQRKFINEAVALLKPGGVMTYSTCTIHAKENEYMVKHVLDEYPFMELLPMNNDLGLPGLPGCGLDEQQCSYVRRFDPTDASDTMGFFVAKFQKRIIQ